MEINDYLIQLINQETTFDSKELINWAHEYGCQCAEHLGFNLSGKKQVDKEAIETAREFTEEKLEEIVSESKRMYEQNGQEYDIRGLFDVSNIDYLVRVKFADRRTRRELINQKRKSFVDGCLEVIKDRGYNIKDETKIQQEVFEKAYKNHELYGLSIRESVENEWEKLLKLSEVVCWKQPNITTIADFDY